MSCLILSNGQAKKDKITNNDLQNFIQEADDRATQTPPKPGGELMCFGRVSNS
jgi:hypothetical protein